MSDIDFEIVKTGNGYANDLAATAAKYANETNKAVQKLETSTQEVKKEVQRLTKVTVALDEKDELLQKLVVKLTWATVALAIAQVIVGVIQLFK